MDHNSTHFGNPVHNDAQTVRPPNYSISRVRRGTLEIRLEALTSEKDAKPIVPAIEIGRRQGLGIKAVVDVMASKCEKIDGAIVLAARAGRSMVHCESSW